MGAQMLLTDYNTHTTAADYWLPVVQQNLLVNVNGLLVVCSKEVDRC